MKADKSAKKSDTKLAVKKGKGKAAKDPNKPKRPASAFFVFMEDFRKEYKEEHPDNKLVSAVTKAGGAKWKAMSDSEKAPFVANAAKRKTEYQKTMKAYNNKQPQAGVVEDEGNDSDKSKSEVNNEDEDESGDEEDDE